MRCLWCRNEARVDGLCVTCLYFLSIADRSEKTIIDHTSYRIGGEKIEQNGRMMGYRFNILYDDGLQLTTYELFCEGEIPSRFWDKLPDNAKFIKDGKVVQPRRHPRVHLEPGEI